MKLSHSSGEVKSTENIEKTTKKLPTLNKSSNFQNHWVSENYYKRPHNKSC